MFCEKCKTKLNGNEIFCHNCGNPTKKEVDTNINSSINEINNTNQTMSERLSKSSKQIINPLMIKLKKFILKYKKQIMIGLAVFFAIIICYVLFNIFYDFTKIKWDKKSSDFNVEFTESTTLNLNVLAYDKEKNKITNIKFFTKNGHLETDGTSVKWELPKKPGKYTITATAPSGKKIQKDVSVVVLDDDKNSVLLGPKEEKVDDKTTDNDKDGLTNDKEKSIGTNMNLSDTDRDGISDNYEITESLTDPLKSDTDSDKINDGDELDLGLDPLKSDSKNDGKKDGDRELSYKINNEKLGLEIEITGKGNIASSTIDVFDNSTFSNMEGLLDNIYNFYSNGTISKAIVKIKYNLDEVTKKGLSEDNLTLYYFDEKNKKLEEISTVVDKEHKILTVTLEHFSKYVIGDKNKVLLDIDTEVMFVIDNSISMYSEQQMVNAGYTNSRGTLSNDTQFKRLTLTNKLVDMFTGNYKFGVAEFSGNYVNINKFSNSKKEIKKSIDSMKSNWETNLSGTNIITALKSGINEFQSDDNNHYLLLLTDGKNTNGNISYSIDTIIDNAKSKNVKICVIGLGKDINTNDLNEIAESTGCDYYNASDSSALDEIYSIVGASINYNFVDTSNDNEIDGMIQSDSGFIVSRDGFSFSNFISNKSEGGHCYGMASFAMLYYTKTLPMSLSPAHKHTIFKKFDPSNGYDLNNTYFSEYGKLYDYKPSNIALNNYLYENPKDYRDRVENDIWMIKKEYHDELLKIGATISIKDNKNKNQEFKKYQSALINIDDETFEDYVKKDDYQVLSAIWRLFILQIDDSRLSFSTEPDITFERLNNDLVKGIPSVISVGGNHAVNAIKLIQDINDSNKFKIEVYDNNFPGEKRYIEVVRSKFSKWQLNYTAWTNEYEYSFMYDKNGDNKLEDISVDIHYPDVES